LQRLGGADAYVVDKAAIDRAIDTMHPVIKGLYRSLI
jgi:hypothetical protein